MAEPPDYTESTSDYCTPETPLNNSERKSTEQVEIVYNEEPFSVTIDLTSSDQLKITITRNIDPYYWMLVTDYNEIIKQERRWSRFLDIEEIFQFLVRELKSKNVKFDKQNGKFQLIFCVKIYKGKKVDLILEAFEKEADMKTMLHIFSGNIKKLSILVGDQDAKLMMQRIEQNACAIKRLQEESEAEKKMLRLAINEKRLFKVFKLTTGSVSLTPTTWMNIPNFTGSLELKVGKVYKWDLIINGQYCNSTSHLVQYRINLQNTQTKATINLPSDIGFNKCYLFASSNVPSDLRESDIFEVQETATYTFQIQVQQTSGYAYQWASNYGTASLFVESN